MTQAFKFTQSHYPADTSQDLLEITLGDLMRRNAREVPDRVALVEGIADASRRRRWTYRQLVDEAETLARALLRTFRPGERIGMLAPDTPEWLIFQHAVNFAGLILVPINPAYTAREVEFVLKNSESSGLIYADTSRGKDLRAIVDAVRPSLPLLRETVRVADYEKLLKSADPAVQLPSPTLSDIVQIQYTSGTTGFPKGACLHHRGVINTSRNIALRAGFPDGGVWINAMPMFHIAGDIVSELGAYVLRGTFVLMSEFNPGLMLELIEEERCETTLIVPTMILALLDHPDCPKRDCSSLLTILSGAANVPAALVMRAQEAFGCGFSIMYGLTESNGPFLETSPADTIKDQTETVGQPAAHSEVRIVDPVTLETQPVDTVGEIWVRGFMTMKGYYGQPEATAAALTPDGWLRTGDLGTMDERGYFKITGRLKEMIIRGGMNLYPQEIENVLFDHPAVGQIAVVGLPSEQWGEIVAAVVLAKDQGSLPSVDELYAHCRANLSPQKTPEQWFFVSEYPLTATGKIQKNVILEWISEARITPVNWTRPEKAAKTA
ncbi:MAG: AMP-binding protein [Rhodobiaceae bacterium]|nr:AMP-binding protein [Rhodobiaceae bacterium]